MGGGERGNLAQPLGETRCRPPESRGCLPSGLPGGGGSGPVVRRRAERDGTVSDGACVLCLGLSFVEMEMRGLVAMRAWKYALGARCGPER